MGGMKQRNPSSAELSTARRIAKELQNLPPLFGETLVVHMKRHKITNEVLADALDISVRKISGLRNAYAPVLSLRALTAICIVLHLTPELSEDLFTKAGLHPLPTGEHVAYRILLRTMYLSGIEECNERLITEGFEPLTTADRRAELKSGKPRKFSF